MTGEVGSRSPRKHEVLRELSESGPLATSELVERVSTSRSSLQNVLSRCTGQRLVESSGGEFTPGGGNTEAQYDITSRGEERLAYYEGTEEG